MSLFHGKQIIIDNSCHLLTCWHADINDITKLLRILKDSIFDDKVMFRDMFSPYEPDMTRWTADQENLILTFNLS